ncbi:sodium-dependent phosphate transporter [Bacillus mangrovi]|uniref:Sodium-dependent phosphate transporter n=1 Tax=Metabacillus mangrovi TaxID=1491830 RepID=A0A7X2S2C6_9BACI|nr:Na/Pi cotransporter family protein [Metabacillus mangrovi]MTH52434.1 sodium-dependent phosphate transporter [Metabacillus mangrovi]
MDFNLQQVIFEFLGGLGIFLFAIKYMGEGLQRAAGSRLRDMLDRFTSNPFLAVLTGTAVAVLIQSSSGTTVIAVGLVSAGFLQLKQAIGVVMGANIGTTVTAFVIGIPVSEYSLPILAAGSLLLFFVKNKTIHHTGQVVFGFGALFFGLELMGKGIRPLGELEFFQELTLSFSANPLLGVLAGTLLTGLVQSSSATIGILQELYGQNLVNLQAALPIMFGDNIGTTITAVLASIGASLTARRTALAHVIFNLAGTSIFLVVLPLFTVFIQSLESNLSLNPAMTIAFAHGSFNITNALIQLPFIGALAWAASKIIPGEESGVEYRTKRLDPMFIEQSVSIALGQAKEEVLRMGRFSVQGLKEADLYLKTNQQKNASNALQIEEALNNLDRKITDYLILISRNELNEGESAEHSVLIDTVRDIERVGDHFENIIELVDYKLTNKVKISEEALTDLEEMFTLTLTTLENAVQSLDDRDIGLANRVLEAEEKIDRMERALRKQHVLRMNSGECNAQAGMVFVDIISNLERIGDHCVNVAEAVLGYRK